MNPRPSSTDICWPSLRLWIDGLTQVAVMKPESANWSILTQRSYPRPSASTHQLVSRWSHDLLQPFERRGTKAIYSVPVLGGDERLVLENAGNVGTVAGRDFDRNQS